MAVDDEVSKLAVQNMECWASNVCFAKKKTQNQSLFTRKPHRKPLSWPLHKPS